MQHLVSFSGGRTSAYLVYLLEQKRKQEQWNVVYIFMETGAEHPLTYKFIRQVAAAWQIPLICLQMKASDTLGTANTFEIIPVSELGHTLKPWKDLLKKYGTPYVGGAFCSRSLKYEVFTHWKKRYYPDAITWLGIRADEPKRIWGEKCYSLLRRAGVSAADAVDLFIRLKQAENMQQILANYFLTGEIMQPLTDRINKIRHSGQRFLAELSDFEKSDVLKWWKRQPFDLEIPEHLGNCVFCIKKSIPKLAAAINDEPELYNQFHRVIYSDNVRPVPRAESQARIMYRNKMTLEDIRRITEKTGAQEIKDRIQYGGGEDPGSCSESCEPVLL